MNLRIELLRLQLSYLLRLYSTYDCPISLIWRRWLFGWWFISFIFLIPTCAMKIQLKFKLLLICGAIGQNRVVLPYSILLNLGNWRWLIIKISRLNFYGFLTQSKFCVKAKLFRTKGLIFKIMKLNHFSL